MIRLLLMGWGKDSTDTPHPRRRVEDLLERARSRPYIEVSLLNFVCQRSIGRSHVELCAGVLDLGA